MGVILGCMKEEGDAMISLIIMIISIMMIMTITIIIIVTIIVVVVVCKLSCPHHNALSESETFTETRVDSAGLGRHTCIYAYDRQLYDAFHYSGIQLIPV